MKDSLSIWNPRIKQEFISFYDGSIVNVNNFISFLSKNKLLKPFYFES